jgi:hypothetical protein
MNIATCTVLGFSLAALAAGCAAGPTADESQLASDGEAATAADTQSQSVAAVVLDPVSVADPAAATAQIASAAPAAAAAALWPAGCVTRAKDPTNPLLVHVTFDDCTGPFGLVHIDGGADALLSHGASGALHAAITGVDLTANGKPIVFAASADVTFPTATTRSVIWQGSWSRTNEQGDSVVHSSDLTIGVDESTGCRTANGTAETTVARRGVDTTITGYTVCHDPAGQEGCPSGAVEHVREPDGLTIHVDFDGSDEAAVTGPKGRDFDLPLVCTPLPASSSDAAR